MRVVLGERLQNPELQEVVKRAQAAPEAEPLEVDAAATKRIDTATAQWLVAVARSGRLQWVGVSAEVRAQLTRLGLSAHAALPEGA